MPQQVPPLPSPETAAHVAEAIYGALIFGALFVVYLYLTQPERDGGTPRWRRWRAAFGDWIASGVPLRAYLSGAYTVNTFEDEGEPEAGQTTPDQQTDQTDRADGRGGNAVSVVQSEPPRFAVDRTRRAVLEELLTHGWTVTDLRREGILRGDNVAISAEVAEARKSLGMEPPTEYRTPIAGRATAASFYEPDPELAYQPPD